MFLTALILGVLGFTGTFAWTSLSQRALNEGSVVLQPGGRIHDDFEGFGKLQPQQKGIVNKDIYAENYSNKPLLVRVKLTEYMELGQGAGLYTVEGESNNLQPTDKNLATVLPNAGLDNAILSDRSTWPAYLPNGMLEDGTVSSIRRYVTWGLGDTNSERKVYMPTFNQNNVDLSSDVTGEGIDELTWTKNGGYDTNQKVLLGTHNQWSLGETHVSTLRTYNNDQQVEETTANVSHTAKETVVPDKGSGYMTVNQWLEQDRPTGNFWIHDQDGWLYWATPLEGKTATSLLLDNLTVQTPDDDMYYAINVISDFATKDDWSSWSSVSENMRFLMERIAE